MAAVIATEPSSRDRPPSRSSLRRVARSTHGPRGDRPDGELCSGPGKLTEALGITHAHNALPLDAPPISLHARTGKVDVVSGIRIGLTKAVELPWRYGLKGSRYLSKPFPE